MQVLNTLNAKDSKQLLYQASWKEPKASKVLTSTHVNYYDFEGHQRTMRQVIIYYLKI